MVETVTVVVAAHPGRTRPTPSGGMPLLQRALASVFTQTRLPDAVHVAMDNHGDGAPVTRGRALATVNTDWVAFLDSDDMFRPRHLELCLRHAEQTGADFVYPWFTILQCFPNGTERALEWSAEHGDGVFPASHFSNDFDPANPIETTITVLVRAELAKQVGMRALHRGEVNTGEDRAFTLDCLAAGATISHLKRFTWFWRHHWLDNAGRMGNTSGRPGKGDHILTS